VSAAPRFDVSIVTAVYDVARYLPEFFTSIADQRGVPLDRVEIVAVDDGSTDESLATLRKWQQRLPIHMTVLTKTNGGQGSARNLGLAHASGEWVTFTDPDDTLEPDYLANVLRFIREHPQVEMVATNRVFVDDATGERSDSHGLRQMFADGDRLVDLDRAPEYFHGSAPAAFLKRARIAELGLEFDHRIRPNFEDGHFCTRYLLGCPAPYVGFVASAVYLYRKRSDGSSTLQNSVMQAERYTHVPRYGYLDVITHGLERFGHTPEWVQNFVIYELSWYFSSEDSPGGTATAATGDVAKDFLDVLTEIRAHLDPEVIASFRVRWLQPIWRQILLHGLSDVPWHSECAVMEVVDADQGLVKVLHRYTGPEPEVEYVSGGVPVTPLHTKVRAHLYFDRVLMWERISWLPSDAALRVRVAGTLLELRRWWYGAVATSADPVPKPAPPRETMLQVALEEPSRVVSSVRRRAVRRLAKTSPVRRRYAQAWVLMDRIHDADDSGEHLFRHLREHRPEINAWFGHPGLQPAQGRAVRRPGRRARLAAVGAADAQLPAPDLLAHRRPGAPAAADRGAVQAGRADLEVHLPPARRDQGRPVPLAERQGGRPVRHEHGRGVRVDRG
jgi:glycosyltransferase involved in cell wall biosynthesis